MLNPDTFSNNIKPTNKERVYLPGDGVAPIVKKSSNVPQKSFRKVLADQETTHSRKKDHEKEIVADEKYDHDAVQEQIDWFYDNEVPGQPSNVMFLSDFIPYEEIVPALSTLVAPRNPQSVTGGIKSSNRAVEQIAPSLSDTLPPHAMDDEIALLSKPSVTLLPNTGFDRGFVDNSQIVVKVVPNAPLEETALIIAMTQRQNVPEDKIVQDARHIDEGTVIGQAKHGDAQVNQPIAQPQVNPKTKVEQDVKQGNEGVVTQPQITPKAKGVQENKQWRKGVVDEASQSVAQPEMTPKAKGIQDTRQWSERVDPETGQPVMQPQFTPKAKKEQVEEVVTEAAQPIAQPFIKTDKWGREQPSQDTSRTSHKESPVAEVASRPVSNEEIELITSRKGKESSETKQKLTSPLSSVDSPTVPLSKTPLEGKKESFLRDQREGESGQSSVLKETQSSLSRSTPSQSPSQELIESSLAAFGRPTSKESSGKTQPLASERAASPKDLKTSAGKEKVSTHEKKVSDLSYVPPQGVPLPFGSVAAATPESKPLLTPSEIQAIVDQVVSKLYTVKTDVSTNIEIILKHPPILDGAKIIVKTYESARGEFNLSFENLTQAAKELLDTNKNSLRLALEDRGCTVHMITTTTLMETPTYKSISTEEGRGEGQRDATDDDQQKKQKK